MRHGDVGVLRRKRQCARDRRHESKHRPETMKNVGSNAMLLFKHAGQARQTKEQRSTAERSFFFASLGKTNKPYHSNGVFVHDRFFLSFFFSPLLSLEICICVRKIDLSMMSFTIALFVIIHTVTARIAPTPAQVK